MDFGADSDVVFAVMRACGVEVDRIGAKFRCPIPGHEEDHASAALWQDEGGPIFMHDFHRRGGREWVPLPDLYASCRIGEDRELTTAQRATWWLRALVEVGVIAIDVPQITLPSEAPVASKRVMAGFAELLELRKVYDPHQAVTAPFSWRFAADWIGVKSIATINKAMNYLLAGKWMKIADPIAAVDQHKRMQAHYFALGPAAVAQLPVEAQFYLNVASTN